MKTLGNIASKIRSKNAGPFWLTIDIFCEDQKAYEIICQNLPTRVIAKKFKLPETIIQRYEIESLNVIKFSFPRPTPQGSIHDRDMHGAGYAQIVAQIEI